MTEQMPLAREPDAAERRMRPVLYVGPYVLLGVLTAFTVIEKHSHGGSLRVDLGLCVLAAAWMLWMFTLHPAWRVRPRLRKPMRRPRSRRWRVLRRRSPLSGGQSRP